MRETVLYRKLLQGQADDVMQSSSPHSSPDSSFHSIDGTSSEFSTSLRSHYNSIHSTSNSSSPLDSSMALTILVLLTAIFFMGFFAIYIRRLAQQEASADIHRLRGGGHHPSSSAGERLCVNRKGKGLDLSTIQSLPLVSYCCGEDAKHLMITGCPICLTEFEVKEIVRLIPHCKHLFHPQCLDTWLSSHLSCPLCRSTQLFLNHVDDEVCLDVKEVHGSSNDSNEPMMMGLRSTENSDDTLSERAPLRFIRSRSYTNLGDRVVLQRSLSF